MVFFLGLISSIANAQSCSEDISTLFSDAQELFFIGDLEKSQQKIESLEQELHCSSIQSSSILGDLYLLKGALFYFSEEEQLAKIYLSSAAPLNSYNWDYGKELHQLYQASPEQMIELRWTLPEEYPLSVWIDGELQTSSFLTSPSPHLIQIQTPQALIHSQFIHPTVDQELQLPRFLTPSPPAPSRMKYLWTLPIASSIFTVSSFALSQRYRSEISSLNTKEEFDAQLKNHQRVHTLGLIGLGTTISSTLFIMVISGNSG